MTLKVALAGLPAGGGKAVVMLGPGLRRARAFERLGLEIGRLGGSFFTGLDVGTTRADLLRVARHTTNVALDLDYGQATARGVLCAMRAACAHRGIELARAGVAVQGLGAVGMALCGLLSGLGARLVVADMNGRLAREAQRRFGAEVVPADRVLRAEVDVLAPCALGGVLSASLARRVKARVVCGSANNQFTGPGAARAFQRAGVTVVPDFAASAGAVIMGVLAHVEGRAQDISVTGRIGPVVEALLREAARRDEPPLETATRRALAVARGRRVES